MKYLIAVFILIFTSEIYAENPQRRICRLTHGLFWGLEIQEPQNDQIGFCNYNNSLMGSISMMQLVYEDSKTEAMTAFFNTKKRSYSSCIEAGAELIEAKELNNPNVWRICYFADDYSFVSEVSLIEGWTSAFNRKLRRALKTRFE